MTFQFLNIQVFIKIHNHNSWSQSLRKCCSRLCWKLQSKYFCYITGLHLMK